MKQLIKPNLHNRKLILSRSEQQTLQSAMNDDIKAGYPPEVAKQRAYDIIMIERQVKAGTFKSKWSF